MSINIAYPSLVPPTVGFAYQEDPALVLVTSAGSLESDVSISNVEEAFQLTEPRIIRHITSYRNMMCEDFQFRLPTRKP